MVTKVEDDGYIICDTCNQCDVYKVSNKDIKNYYHTTESWEK